MLIYDEQFMAKVVELIMSVYIYIYIELFVRNTLNLAN